MRLFSRAPLPAFILRLFLPARDDLADPGLLVSTTSGGHLSSDPVSSDVLYHESNSFLSHHRIPPRGWVVFSVLYVTRFIQYDYEIRKILYKNKKGRVENAFLYIFSSKKPLDLISSFYNGT